MQSIQSSILIASGSSAPANPSSGYILLYVKSDNGLYIRLNDGTEKQIS